MRSLSGWLAASACAVLLACAACADSPHPSAPPDAPSPGVSHAVVASTAPTVVEINTDDFPPELLRRSILPQLYAAVVDSGSLYTAAYANSPSCCPSRATFFTTLPQHVHGVLDNNGIGGGAPAFVANGLGPLTIAVALQQQGYLTAIHGKWLNLYQTLSPQPYISPGWSEWRVPVLAKYWSYQMHERPFDSALVTRSYGTLAKDHLTNVLKRNARDLILRAPPTQPVFLYVAPLAPHHPWTAQASDVGSCAAEPVTLDVEADVSDKPAYIQALPAITPAQMTTAIADWRKQCETLKAVDRLVGEIIAALRATGRWQNTLLIFTADNGITHTQHRLFERKKSLYASAVPLAIRYPGQTVPQVVTAPVSVLDVSATIRALAGVPGTGYGQSLLLGAPQDVLIEHEVVAPIAENFTALRSGSYVYAEYPHGSATGGLFVELYDVATDPGLNVNLAGSPSLAAVQATLAARLAVKRAQ